MLLDITLGMLLDIAGCFGSRKKKHSPVARVVYAFRKSRTSRVHGSRYPAQKLFGIPLIYACGSYSGVFPI